METASEEYRGGLAKEIAAACAGGTGGGENCARRAVGARERRV
jgi:hypothetical protein